MSLEKYYQKRNFDKTTEPKGEEHSVGKEWVYIIQKHAASHLHYDLRLSLEGVLKSWAVPKGPSYNTKEKRLAVEVEDHPLEYASFEGIIPKDEYGGGTVMLWDKGTWEPINDPEEGLKKGKLAFRLHGQKLKGEWALVRMHTDDAKPNWLLIKHTDDYANCLTDKELLETVSAKSGKTMQQIAAGKQVKTKATSRAHHNQKALAGGDDDPDPGGVSGAKKSAFPRQFNPELTTLVKDVPEDSGWLFETKYDGNRLLGFIQNGKVELITRHGKDWTNRYGRVADALAKLPVQSAIVDGEIVALDGKGISRFQLLQNCLEFGDKRPLYFYLFDIPYCNGYDLSHVTFKKRKELLRNLMKGFSKKDAIRFSDYLQGQAKTIFKQACSMGLEGVVAKREASFYQQKRTMDWVKIKCMQRQEFVICGYTDPGGARQYFGSLLLGVYDDNKQLVYCGRVGTGFDRRLLKDLYQKFQPYKAKQTPYDQLPSIPEVRGVHWLKPVFVGEIEFTEWTQEGRIRHPSFKGLREDKSAIEVHAEMPIQNRSSDPHPIFSELAGVHFSHTEKLFFPTVQVSKGDLAQYYHRYIDWILPHLQNRPLAILRCIEGMKESCFYQKHKEGLPDSIGQVMVQEKHAKREHLVVKNEASILALVQHGALEFHTWNCLADNLEKPDRMIFDLDPGQNVGFEHIIEAAQALQVRLEALGLISFVKTSGKKGLHVVVPLKRVHTWEEVKSFSHGLAVDMASVDPDRYVATISKAKRVGKILIDYLRNERGATCIAAYSTRATEKASISTPLSWSELSKIKSAGDYGFENIAARLGKLKKDPWAEYFAIKQQITASMRKKYFNIRSLQKC